MVLVFVDVKNLLQLRCLQVAHRGWWHFLVLGGCAVSVGSGVATEWGCDSVCDWSWMWMSSV